MRMLPLLAVVLTACGAPQDAATPDARGAFNLHCNQSELRWNACYQKAARVCGERGYQVVSDERSALPSGATDIFEVPIIGGAMVIRCNP